MEVHICNPSILRKLRQEDQDLETTLDYIARPYLKKLLLLVSEIIMATEDKCWTSYV
jgi:hypothetical protein